MSDWTALRQELSIWRADGRPLPLWWRDDDATADTPQLTRLTALSREIGLPVHLAIIPAHVNATLVEAVAQAPSLVPAVHGWAHENHAPGGQKKSEFGHPRPEAAIEIARGLQHMTDLFGPRLLPLFVPPWNRLDPGYLPLLAQAGYLGLSSFLPRQSICLAPGLTQINTHIDPIDWHGSRSLLPTDDILSRTLQVLQDRRAGRTDRSEPLGYLTHHLVHDDPIWDFSRSLLGELLEGGGYAADLPTELERTDEPS